MKPPGAIVIFILVLLPCTTVAGVHHLTLWAEGVPGAIENPLYRPDTVYVDGVKPRIYRISNPSLEYYPPPEGTANGTAVIICPGGGYTRLAVDIEGYDIAAWLNSMGVAAFILIYRLPSDDIMVRKSVGPLQDGQEAVRYVRRHATDLHIDPARIGVMGFSAGGHLAATASTHWADSVYAPTDTTSARPDFSILVYPVVSMDSAITHHGSRTNLLGMHPSPGEVRWFSNERQVTDRTPPAFLVHASDDRTVPVENSIRYMQALHAHNVPVEMHIYQAGGHGFGMGREGTEREWPEACRQWMLARGIIAPVR